MKNKDIIEIEKPKVKTISFFELLKLKILNQSENASRGFCYFSIFLSVFNMLSLNTSFAIIGAQSKILAQQTGNFWVVLVLILPFIFLSVLSFLSSFLSKDRKNNFSGQLSFYLSLFDFFVVLFFWIFISAVF